MASIGALLEAPELPQVKVPKVKKRVLNHTAQARILSQIPEERRGLWLARGLARLRPAEARNACVHHYRDGIIDLTPEIVKTEEPRSLKVSIVAPELDDWIRRWRANAPPWEPLFRNPSALNAQKRWKPNAEWKCWAKACRDAGVEHVRPNWGGRHAFATHEAKGGTNLLGLQTWLGHARFETTRLYLDEFDADELALMLRPERSSNLPRGDLEDEKPLGIAGVLVGDTGFEPAVRPENTKQIPDSRVPETFQGRKPRRRR
jgi:integrase